MDFNTTLSIIWDIDCATNLTLFYKKIIPKKLIEESLLYNLSASVAQQMSQNDSFWFFFPTLLLAAVRSHFTGPFRHSTYIIY